MALVYNGIAHSVMMCWSSDLEDFAIGFSLSEGIIDSLLDIHDIEQIDGCQGIELHITLANRCVHRLKEKRRTLAGRTGCGICGSESLEQVIRTQPVTTAHGSSARRVEAYCIATHAADAASQGSRPCLRANGVYFCAA